LSNRSADELSGLNRGTEIENPILSEPRVGYGQKGTGSGNKVDLIPDQPVFDSNGQEIEIVFPTFKHRPFAVQELSPTARGHGFTDIVDNYAGYAQAFPQQNGAIVYQLEGTLNGVLGRFEWVLDPMLGGLTHRMFVKGGKINGGLTSKP
jgi:filamentous hemagglutinin